MKKSVIIFGAALLLVTAFSSCKKDYTCECTFSYTGSDAATVTVPSSYSATLTDTKSKAKDACEKSSSTITIGPTLTQVYTCKIK